MSNEKWHGRTCKRPRKDCLDACERRRHIQTYKCTGGPNNTSCLSCQLKIAQNGNYNGSSFRVKSYVSRVQTHGEAMKNLKLVNNPIGIPKYNNAPWIIQIFLCDYLDEFNSLYLVNPPSDYIRNPACVKRDEELRKAEQQRVEQRHAYIIPRVIQAISNICWGRFRCSKYDTRYGKFQPDWVQYRIVCMEKWSDANVSQAEIDAEATRLI